MEPLLLASQSPRRRKILEFIGIPFRVVKPVGVIEKRSRGESPRQMVCRLALLKAIQVSRRYPRSLVLGADTTVVCGKNHFEKPRSKDEARWMLEQLQGKSQIVWTGIAFVSDGGRRRKVSAERTRVFFRKITPAELNLYLRTREPYDKAGGYDIQGTARKWVRKWEGDYFNVMGLPITKIIPELNRWKPRF